MEQLVLGTRDLCKWGEGKGDDGRWRVKRVEGQEDNVLSSMCKADALVPVVHLGAVAVEPGHVQDDAYPLEGEDPEENFSLQVVLQINFHSERALVGDRQGQAIR